MSAVVTDFAIGAERYRARAFTEAAAIFRCLAADQPDNADTLYMLGLCQMRLGDVHDALVLLARARELAPDNAYAQLHYGMGLHAVGRDVEAAEQFRMCQRLLPADPAPFLNLATVLLSLGDTEAALDAARRARRRAMNLPEAHYTVGLALLAAGRLEDAIQAFADTLQLAPNFVDAWVNLGVIRYRRNDIAGARKAMQRALQIQPGHRAAAANLAAFLRLTGEAEAAETLLEETLSRNPDAGEVRVNLAAAFLQEERSAEALALLDAQPIPAEPRLAVHWNLQRVLALLQQGRAGEACTALDALHDVPPELAPLATWRRVELAVAERDHAAARAHAEAMEASLDTAPLVPEHRIIAHYDLARFWLAQGNPARAFGQWTQGHRLLGRFQPFSRDNHRRFVDASIARLDRARLHHGPRAGSLDAAPVFIVGMPRSGTTLAEQIIGAHPRAHAAGERGALTQAFLELGGVGTPDDLARIAGHDAADLDRVASSYLAQLHSLAPQADRIVDKMPGNANFLGLVALLLPGARIIHCVRDPRDIGLSIYTFRFYGHHPYAHDLADLGWYIAQHGRLMAHWQASVPNPILTLALQDWVNDFPGTLRRVLDFLELPYDAACERFYERDTRVRTVSRSQVRQPINARGIGRWRAFEPQLQPLIAALIEGGALPVSP